MKMVSIDNQTTNGNMYDSIFPTKLRKLLEENGKGSQAKLAKHIGVSRQAVSAYSLGETVPDMYKFIKISEFFDVSLEYLTSDTTSRKLENIDIASSLGLSDEAIDKIKDVYLEAEQCSEKTFRKIQPYIQYKLLNSLLSDNRFWEMLKTLSGGVTRVMNTEKIKEALQSVPDNAYRTKEDIIKYYEDQAKKYYATALNSFGWTLEQVYENCANENVEELIGTEIDYVIDYFKEMYQIQLKSLEQFSETICNNMEENTYGNDTEAR